MPGDLAVTVTNPAASQVLTAPAFVAEWNHTRVSDGAATVQNDYRVRIYGTDTLTYQTVTTDATKSPATLASDAGNGGTLAWVNPASAGASDDVYATVMNGSGAAAVSQYLKATGLGFSVPSNADVLGVEVLGERKGTGTVGYNGRNTATALRDPFVDSSVTVNVPAGLANGDTLIAVVTHLEQSRGAPGHASWTSVASGVAGNTVGDYDLGVTVLKHLVTDAASEPASYTFTMAIDPSDAWYASLTGAIFHYTDVDFAGIYAGTFTTPTSAPSASAVDVTTPNSRVLYVLGAPGQNDGIITPPSGYSERAETYILHSSIGSHTGYVADRLYTLTGSTGTVTPSGVITGGTREFVNGLVVLPPAAVNTARVSLVLSDGTIGTENKADVSPWTITDQVVVWGSAADKWGATLTPAVVNSPNFGAVISATVADGAVASLDHVQVRVYYRFADLMAPLTSPVYDSAQTASAVGQHSLPATWGAQNSQTYHLRVDVTDADGLEGASDLRTFSTAWTPPPSVTGVTVTPRGGVA